MSFCTGNYPSPIKARFRPSGLGQIARSTVVGLALVAVAACRTTPTSSLTPTGTVAPGRVVVATRWVALLEGELVLADGCLRVNGTPGDTSYLLVWPPEYAGKVTIEGDAVRVIDGDTTVVWHVGDVVRLGGGEVGSIEHLSDQPQPQSRADCPGPYWVVGDVAGPAARATAEAAHPPATPGPEATTAVLSVEETRRRDAQEYARLFGVSLDEALRRAELRESFDGLGAELEEKERDTFAGLWIQHTPEYRLIVRFTRDGEETIRPYIEGKPYAGIVEVRAADLTLAELLIIEEQAARVVRELPASYSDARFLSVNVFENRVEVHVADRAQFEAALREAGSQLPDHAVVVAPEPAP